MQPMSYYARYYSTENSRLMLGGVMSASSSRYSHRDDAIALLETVISIHASLPRPLQVAGKIFESTRPAEIIRHCITPQAKICFCPECGALV